MKTEDRLFDESVIGSVIEYALCPSSLIISPRFFYPFSIYGILSPSTSTYPMRSTCPISPRVSSCIGHLNTQLLIVLSASLSHHSFTIDLSNSISFLLWISHHYSVFSSFLWAFFLSAFIYLYLLCLVDAVLFPSFFAILFPGY